MQEDGRTVRVAVPGADEGGDRAVARPCHRLFGDLGLRQLPVKNGRFVSPSADELARWLRAQGVLTDVRVVTRAPDWLRRHGVSVVAAGNVTVGTDVCPLEVRIPHGFPAALPRVALDPTGPFAGLPHVGIDGVICYRDADSATADPARPVDIVHQAVEMARQTLLDGRSPGAAEYANEVVAYWDQFLDAPICASLVEPGDAPRLISSYRDRRGALVLVGTAADLAAFTPTREQGGQARNALYVPIDLGTTGTVHPKVLATRRGFVEQVMPVLTQVPRRWRRFCRRCRGRTVDVLLGVERSAGLRGVIGVRVETRHQVRESPLLMLDKCTFTPLRVQRGDRAFIVPRGGASGALADRRVLLIGCGSVGGHIALGLARSGVGHLELVDHDRFEIANTYRHVCGRAYLGEYKCEGLRREIQRLIPYVAVTSRRSNVLALLEREPNLFGRFDLIVAATGAPMVEQRVNEAILSTPGAPAGVFAWLEPLGIGAHVLTMNAAGRRQGCLECLYGTDDGRYVCRAAFAAPDERYRRDAMGCGGQFVPFGDVDASHVAVRAVGKALALMQGDDTAGLLSLKGAGREFREAGFQTTPRYEHCGPETMVSSDELRRPTCPACGS